MSTFQIILQSLFISLLIQIFFFIIAAINKTDKVTDLSYGLTFILITIFSFISSDQAPVHWLLLAMIAIWGVRLSGYLFIRIMKIKVDDRFNKIRNSVVEFGKFWLLQAISVWIIMLPAIVFFAQSSSLRVWSILGLVIWLTGLTIETTADIQKFQYKNNPKNKNRWTDVGLWKYSRHPNYFGEMMCWWGVFLFCLPTFNNYQFLTVVGPMFITFLLLFVSGVPPLEKRYLSKFGDNQDYQDYLKNTNLLVPVPRFNR